MVLKVDGSEDKDLHKVISENGLAKHMDHFIRLAQFLRIKTTLFPPGQVRKKMLRLKTNEFLLTVRKCFIKTILRYGIQ